MDNEATAWIAGLFEGEGSIVFAQKNSVVVTIFMTDEDVVRRCGALVGAGTVRGPYTDSKRPTNKPMWKWSIFKGAHVEPFLRAIYPWMGSRRQARIEEALDRLSLMRGRERCQQGHKNWRIDGRGHRYCRDCANIRQRLRRGIQ